MDYRCGVLYTKVLGYKVTREAAAYQQRECSCAYSPRRRCNGDKYGVATAYSQSERLAEENDLLLIIKVQQAVDNLAVRNGYGTVSLTVSRIKANHVVNIPSDFF